MYIFFPSDDTFALECLLTEIYWSGYSKDLKGEAVAWTDREKGGVEGV